MNFSPNCYANPTIVDLWFIAGMSDKVISKLPTNISQIQYDKLKPEILLQFPKKTGLLEDEHLSVSFIIN